MAARHKTPKLKEYKPGKQLELNQERASKVQPLLKTCKGIGNWNQYALTMLNNKEMK